jgi:hypothetical protein
VKNPLDKKIPLKRFLQRCVNKRTRLNLFAFIILLIGLGSAIFIYLTFEDPPDSVFLEYEQSKMYRHEMEAVGGKLNILTNDFMRWIDGLLHGKPLGFTVGFISLFISLGVFYIAHHVPSDSRSDDREENNRDKIN